MFLLGRLSPSKHEVSDLEDSPSDFSFMVPAESLLVASGADDGHLPALHSSVVVESLYSWGRHGRGRRAALP